MDTKYKTCEERAIEKKDIAKKLNEVESIPKKNLEIFMYDSSKNYKIGDVIALKSKQQGTISIHLVYNLLNPKALHLVKKSDDILEFHIDYFCFNPDGELRSEIYQPKENNLPKDISKYV